jgi:hypothetical protein
MLQTPRRVIAITFIAFAAAQAVFFARSGGGQPLGFSAKGLENVAQTFAPLFAIAAFIERAVEVVISTWRGPKALELTQAVDAAKAAETESRKHEEAVQHYRMETQAYAFAVSLGLSMFASMAGVRAVAALVGPTQSTSPRQQLGFTILDVTLTSLLLAGGSDGIHQVVTTITQFLATSKDKMKS